jgi:hypothetical protein
MGTRCSWRNLVKFLKRNRAVRSSSGGAEEQPKVPTRKSRELPASVQSSGRCWEVRRGTWVVFRGGSMTAAQRCSGGEVVEEEGKGLLMGGCSFYRR